MSSNKEELLGKIAEAVVDMEEDTVEELTNQTLAQGIDPYV